MQTCLGADPIADFELFRTSDPIEAQTAAARVTAPHRLQVRGRHAEFAAAVQAVKTGPATLFVQRYGAEITLDRPGYDGCVSVLIPLTGRLVLEQRGREYVAIPGCSMVVFSPGQGGTRLRWPAETTVMSLKAEADELSRALRWIAPHAEGRPFVATSPLLAGPALGPVLGTAQLFIEVFSRYGPNRKVPLPLAKQVREQTLSTLWLSVPNNHTDTIYDTRVREGSCIRTVLDLIVTESCAEFTVPDLARAMNIGVRALELAFRKELGESPLRYLHRTRMERAHDELRNLDPSETTVTEVAQRWGFGHLGRFAARYHARFGEMPSETLAAKAR